MTRIAYINGAYVNHADAHTHIEDRGYQLADGVYEYIAFYNRRLLDGEAHLERLSRSLGLISIPEPMSQRALLFAMNQLIAKNLRDDGGLYMQVTRGVARRDHGFPKNTKPVLSMTICAAKLPKQAEMEKGVRVITRPDIRWSKCDIKTISLLGNVLAKQEAAVQGARENWLVRDGHVTEGSASNSYIVTNEGVVTHPADNFILPGITRTHVLRMAREAGIGVVERPFSVEEAYFAQEAFLTSTSPNVLPVVQIDDKKVGSGAPGPVTAKLRTLYNEHIFQQTGKRLI